MIVNDAITSHRTRVQPYHPSGRHTIDKAEKPFLLLQDNTPNFGEETVGRGAYP